MQTTTDKQHAIELLDRLNAGQLLAVVQLLEVMSNPGHVVIAARPDDEPVTAEDARRVRRGQEWFAERGVKGIPMSEVLADFGLKAEDFPTGR
jgi:hypothetical protein